METHSFSAILGRGPPSSFSSPPCTGNEIESLSCCPAGGVFICAMAADAPRKRLRDGTTCPLCLDFFTDPVSVECGHNFCRGCILKCWEKPVASPVLCPQCRETVQQESLRPNRQLANVVDAVKQLNDQGTEAAAAWGVCESHQELLKFFCMDDEAPICVVCERSKGHRAHQVVPAEEAAEEYKDQIQISLDKLRKKKEEFLASRENMEKQSECLLETIERERQRTVAAFRHFRQFLEEEEDRQLAQMEEVGKEIATKRDEDVARLSEELSSLEKDIQEMEEKCAKPPRELLKDIISVLQRCEQQEKFEILVGFPPVLKWRVWESWDFHPVFEMATERFKDTLKRESQQQKENVTLDPKRAHPQLLISEDRKCVTLDDQQQSLPDSIWRRVLGSRGFYLHGYLRGSFCWDVDVGKEGGWAIGVCSGGCSSRVLLGPERGVWAIGKWEGQYRAVIPPLNPPLAVSEEPKKIRVSLNCEGRQVAFFDAETAALLYTFRIPAGVVAKPFFGLQNKSCLKLAP